MKSMDDTSITKAVKKLVGKERYALPPKKKEKKGPKK